MHGRSDSDSLKALLLCAGFGKRLMPLTKTTPKPLVPIGGRPLLWYWINMLTRVDEIDEIFINTHHLGRDIEDFIESNFPDLPIRILHERRLLGTAGTLFQNSDRWSRGDVFVAHADNFSFMDIRKFIERFHARSTKICCTMGLFTADDPSSCGIVELDSENTVYGFYEKVENPPGFLANAAVYVFDRQIFERFNKHNFLHADISLDLIPKILGQIEGFDLNCYHRDIGNLSSYHRAQLDVNGDRSKDFAQFMGRLGYEA